MEHRTLLHMYNAEHRAAAEALCQYLHDRSFDAVLDVNDTEDALSYLVSVPEDQGAAARKVMAAFADEPDALVEHVAHEVTRKTRAKAKEGMVKAIWYLVMLAGGISAIVGFVTEQQPLFYTGLAVLVLTFLARKPILNLSGDSRE